MTFQVEITPIAEIQIEKAYRWYRERNPEFADRWFRELMNTIATLQEKPQRCALAVEHEIFPEEVRQLLYGKAKNVYRVLFAIRDDKYLSKINYTYLTPLLPLASCLLPIFTRKLILHDYLPFLCCMFATVPKHL
ncbi:MAG: type II toxin-antitoxin system RelE/ParE family toxin [Microcystis panniformis]|jgi:plasmid stabilization system protein ParE|nr:type II toxin-antitoxin system RelE/ParE family toxin [Microcystis aeruginosa F13-15]